MTPSVSTPTILVVDDETADLRLITNMLTEQGYIVRPVKSGPAALDSARVEAPDLILLDVNMPGMDGYDVCECLNQDERLREAPVIFLSSRRDAQDKVRALTLGAVDYISKPFDQREVIARVQTHLTISTLQRQLQEQVARYHTLADATFEAVFLHEQGCIEDVNRLAEQLSGYSREELLGTPITELVHPQDREHVLYAHRTDDTLKREMTLLSKTGQHIPVEVRSKPLNMPERNLMVTTMRDLSHDKQMEAEKAQLHQENLGLRADIQARCHLGEIIGKSRVMQHLYESILHAASNNATVMIQGESGAGKELVAHTIHRRSVRHEHAFVIVNCGAVSTTLFEREFFGHRKGAFTGADRDTPGFVEAANGGTLFLDEVGELTQAMQVALLRVIETQEYTRVGDTQPRQADVRILAATNRNLEEEVARGRIREDFYYRLHVIAITMPPLRERREDIPLLLEHILTQHQQRYHKTLADIPAKILHRLMHYDWPGNVRELQNEVLRYLSTGQITLKGVRKASSTELQALDDLEADETAPSLNAMLDHLERQILLRALHELQWHRSRVAERLGIDRKTLYKKMKKHDIG